MPRLRGAAFSETSSVAAAPHAGVGRHNTMDTKMSYLELILSGSNAVLTFLLGFLLNSYLSAYAQAKAKNLATKEDIADITKKVETVRAEVAKETILLEKRRDLYEKLADTMRIFISGHSATEAQKEAFHTAYVKCWLWAPDSLIQTLNDFLEMQKDVAADQSRHRQEELKNLFCAVITEMRKDAGFSETAQSQQTFAFVRF